MNNTQQYKFVCHSKCEYFPCHAGADPERFNCLFCYCPLYVLDDQCGGKFSYTKDGLKDCSDCLLPHAPEGFDYIVARYPEIAALMQQRRNAGGGGAP